MKTAKKCLHIGTWPTETRASLRAACVACFLLLGPVTNVHAKEVEGLELLGRFELEAGVGYASVGGVSGSAPSLPSVSLGLAVWPWERHGFAFGYVRSVGEGLYDEPIWSDDRVYFGVRDLHYFRFTYRYRRPIGEALMLYIGGGLSLGGRLQGMALWMSPEGPMDVGAEISFGMYAMEILIGRDLGDHFGLKGGATLDCNDDHSVFSPVVIGSVSF